MRTKSELKRKNLKIVMQLVYSNTTYFDLFQKYFGKHTTTLRAGNLIYLLQGGGNDCRQNDVPVTLCILSFYLLLTLCATHLKEL